MVSGQDGHGDRRVEKKAGRFTKDPFFREETPREGSERTAGKPMYKLLLTWRYLLTRYIALICVISVTLGVATMIVVNAVMLGFSREMENRMHGALSDVTISSWASLRGFEDVDGRIRDVWKVAGDMVEAVTPTVATQALLNYEISSGEVVTKPIELIGVDTLTQEKVTAISQYLQHPENRKALSFDLYENGYDVQNHLAGDHGIQRPLMAGAGWGHRRNDAIYENYRREERERQKEMVDHLTTPQSDFDPNVAGAPPLVNPDRMGEENRDGNKTGTEDEKGGKETMELVLPEEGGHQALSAGSMEEGGEENDPYSAALEALAGKSVPDYDDPFQEENGNGVGEGNASEGTSHVMELERNGEPVAVIESPLTGYDEFTPTFDKATQQNTGAILGIGLVSGNRGKVVDPETKKVRYFEPLFVVPGDDVTISLLALGNDRALPTIVYDTFTVTDLYESRMVLYDQSFVFVPIEKLQKMRNMIGPDGKKMASQILIKAKPGVDINALRDRLQAAPEFSNQFMIKTWRDSQANMLEAVAIELGVLNVLLFLIIAVAGFGILAIFFMIVVEKTRDIGILKSLGAGGSGVMQIFLYYGLALGLLGSGLGLILGIVFVKNINALAGLLSKIMGHDVFNPEIYNFYEVPAIIEPWTVIWIVVGSVAIAVISGIIPALRAARLKPVDALRV